MTRMAALFSKTPTETPRAPYSFSLYSPVIQTDRLVPGVDNVRFDVSLSSQFLELCRGLIFPLIVRHSNAAELLYNPPAPPRSAEIKEFQQQLQDLLVTTLNRANVEKNPQLELLAEAAVFKHLALELQAQYSGVLVQAREKLKLFEGPAHHQKARAYQLQELFSNFQKDKKIILRCASQELLGWVQQVRSDVVRRIRESFFGEEVAGLRALFSHPLVFTEDGKDDYLYLEHYVMLGNFQRDPDRFDLVDQAVRNFLEWADAYAEESQQLHRQRKACDEMRARLEELRQQREKLQSRKGIFSLAGRRAAPDSLQQLEGEIAPLEAQFEEQTESLRLLTSSYSARLDKILAAPENALLVDLPETERALAEAHKQGASRAEIEALQQTADRQQEALDKLAERLSRANLVPYIQAAYETARIYPQFCPPIHPQQLKVAVADGEERKKVAHLIREYRLPPEGLGVLEEAARRVREARSRDIQSLLVRFFRDYLRCQHALCNFRLAQTLIEQVHIPTDPRLRELSEINHTLYRFFLAAEEKPAEDKIASHVILKADIRGSTSITEQLLARGLNPASYFSLNFFDPINKLLPGYGASKVFLEGDAVILAILEREGDTRGANSVARACCLAREMIEGVRAVNEKATQNQLPLLELGIGVCFQPSPPMYLKDGETPIMISQALNQSDRLSSCGKLARQVLTQRNRFFNVFLLELGGESEAGGASEEFLLHYNVYGIEMNEFAFDKLAQEISLKRLELKLPLHGEPEAVELHCGLVPLSPSNFQKLVVRRGLVPRLHAKDYSFLGYTERQYFEVCSARPLLDYVSRQLGW